MIYLVQILSFYTKKNTTTKTNHTGAISILLVYINTTLPIYYTTLIRDDIRPIRNKKCISKNI